METFTITLSQTLVLFLFVVIGYWLSKTGKADKNFSKGISNLIVYFFLPFLVFKSFADNFTSKTLFEKSDILFFSSILLGVLFVIAYIFSRILTKVRTERDIYLYSLLFPNAGYFGYPLVLGLYGEEALFELVIFCIPFFVLTYTFGVYILNPTRKFSLKHIINPTFVFMMLGMITGVFGIKLPYVAQEIIDMGAECMAPSAMILTGMVFASKDLEKMFSSLKIFVTCFIKLFILPLVALYILAPLPIPSNVKFLIIVQLVLPTGLNSIVFPEAYGGDSTIGAQLCFTSMAFCLVLIPLMYMLFNNICL